MVKLLTFESGAKKQNNETFGFLPIHISANDFVGMLNKNLTFKFWMCYRIPSAEWQHVFRVERPRPRSIQQVWSIKNQLWPRSQKWWDRCQQRVSRQVIQARVKPRIIQQMSSEKSSELKSIFLHYMRAKQLIFSNKHVPNTWPK